MKEITMIVQHRGLPLEVDISFTPASRGHRDSFGAPEEPDYPAEIDINEVRLEGHEILCLMDDNEISKVRDKILRGEATT